MKSRLHHSPKNDRTKCVRYIISNRIERVPTEIADEAVRLGRASFVPKKDWKAQERQEKKAA